jgi:hypothetical protein
MSFLNITITAMLSQVQRLLSLQTLDIVCLLGLEGVLLDIGLSCRG